MPAITQTDIGVRFVSTSKPAVRFNDDVEMEEEQQAQMSAFEESVKQQKAKISEVVSDQRLSQLAKVFNFNQ